ncbi:MAG: hypothetical protein IJ318_02120 [Clostridia bacterium]|nr:hypothetical protein [Clostridia bacterium]
MKKILLVLLLCSCFLFAGCNSIGGTGLVQYSDGTITEYYFVPFNAEQIYTQTGGGITLAELILIRQNIRTSCDALMTNYINEYKSRIQASEDYTEEQKEVLIEHGVMFDSNFNNKTEIMFGLESKNYVIYELFFANKLCYLEFKGANPELEEQKQTITESNLFTTTTKTIKDPMLDNVVVSTITLGKYFTQACEQQMINVIGQSRWDYNKQLLNFEQCANTFAYCYVVPTGRLHSNADSIVCIDGQYYHIWNIPANNLTLDEEQKVTFEYWTVTANKYIWYILALIISGGIIGGVIVYAKLKQRREINQLVDIINEKNNQE